MKMLRLTLWQFMKKNVFLFDKYKDIKNNLMGMNVV